MPVFAVNKRAKYDYNLLEDYEAGIVLSGSEVRSIREGNIHLKNAYVTIREGELFLKLAYIAPYGKAPLDAGYNPEQDRKLLLHKREIKRLIGKIQQQGLTLIPLKVYTMGNRVKIAIALASGKKKHDKREANKDRDVKRKINRALKQY